MNKIKICLITDNNYAIPTAVAIVSMIENKNADSIYEINILAVELDDFHKRKLKELEKGSVSINIIDFDSDRYKQIKAKTHVNNSALIKFDIANIFHNYEKILYLDGDVIVQKDLSELYNLSLEDFLAICVRDMGAEVKEKFHNVIGINKYFNSGVMLLNLDKIRYDNLSETLFKTKKNNPNWPCMDQDVFNFVFENKVKWVEPKYNAMLPLYIGHGYSLKDVNKFYNTCYKSFYVMQEGAHILHFAGESHLRPWKVINGTMSDVWMRYYNLSPYKNIDLHRTVFIEESDSIKYFHNEITSMKDQINYLTNELISTKAQVNFLNSELKIIKASTFKSFIEKILKSFKYFKYSSLNYKDFN